MQVPKFFTEVLSPKLPLKALKDPGLLQGMLSLHHANTLEHPVHVLGCDQVHSM